MYWGARVSYFCFIPLVSARYVPVSRWGQATALVESTLYIHGGLSDPYNTYSYASAPATPDVLLLDLSASFDASEPPWQLLSTTSSPGLAWHTLSAFNTTHLLLFGGQPGPNSRTVLTTNNDSAVLFSTSHSPAFVAELQNWAGEPMRRMRHAASSTDGKVWIVGGERADGSGSAFEDHFVFDPYATEFTPLPPDRLSPPDIYGHASLVLTDGRLVVLGGYCASCGKLVPMNIVRCLDTTKTNSGWQLLEVSNTPFPDPRREFAAVALPNGNILIHGGADAQLQKTYSDGWILDTSQNPMSWHSVEALSQIGPRKDHTAIQASGLILFCFGYGSSAPAPASLLIYDPVSSAMVSRYTVPASAIATIQSLSGPTQTGASSGSGNNGGVQSGSTPSNGASISDSPEPSDTSASTTKPNSVAIALGTTFGLLGLVAGVMAVYYIKRRQNRRSAGRFAPLDGEFEDKSRIVGSDTVPNRHTADWGGTRPETGVFSWMLSHLGIQSSRRIPHQPRRDMFADEETRSFNWRDRFDASHRADSDRTSSWSLRSMSAAVRGMISREPSTSSTPEDKGNNGGHIRKEQLAIVQEKNAKGRSSGNQQVLIGESTRDDPFADPQQDDDYHDLDLRPGVLEQDEEYDRSLFHGVPLQDYDLTSIPSLKPTFPLSSPLRTLGSPQGKTYTPGLSGSSTSTWEPSHNEPSISPYEIKTVSSTISKPPYCPSEGSPAHSPLSKLPLLPSQLLCRSNSWWARFAKTPLLERRSSVTHKPFDFRDPASLPSLATIEEAVSSQARLGDLDSTFPLQKGESGRDKSVRSSQSARSVHTANTEAVEQLGKSYDVVQHALSEASLSRCTLASTISNPSETPNTAAGCGAPGDAERGSFTIDLLGRLTPAVSLSHCNSSCAESVVSTTLKAPMTLDLPGTTSTTDTQSGLKIPVSTLNNLNTFSLPSEFTQSTSTESPGHDSGCVLLHQMHTYEGQLVNDPERKAPSSPRNTCKQEMPARGRPKYRYGLVPRASLYIANPDVSEK